MPARDLDPSEKRRLQRRGLALEWGTIVWNLGEAVITVTLGVAAGSIALVAFGLDSLIEVFASSVVVWHVREGHEHDTHKNRLALRLIAVAFAALGASLLVGAGYRFTIQAVPEESPLGIAYLALAALVMFVLAYAKRRVGDQLDNDPLRAEAGITFLDGLLAVGILTALALNGQLGWWWADPVAAIVVAFVAFNEAREHWEDADEANSPTTTDRP